MVHRGKSRDILLRRPNDSMGPFKICVFDLLRRLDASLGRFDKCSFDLLRRLNRSLRHFEICSFKETQWLIGPLLEMFF